MNKGPSDLFKRLLIRHKNNILSSRNRHLKETKSRAIEDKSCFKQENKRKNLVLDDLSRRPSNEVDCEEYEKPKHISS